MRSREWPVVSLVLLQQWVRLYTECFILFNRLGVGHVPIIRSPRGNAAEMVAKRLESKIRDAILSASRSHASTSSSLFSQDATGLSNLQRPCQLYPCHQQFGLIV